MDDDGGAGDLGGREVGEQEEPDGDEDAAGAKGPFPISPFAIRWLTTYPIPSPSEAP
jgi:hypothetical protein